MKDMEPSPYVTHPSLYSDRTSDIRDIADAYIILEAVRLKILPLIKRRLVAHERAQLRSGNIFVWEECDDPEEDGLVRWTEGRRWSQSRMRGDYLFYEEKIETTYAEKQAKAARRASKASDSSVVLPAPPKRKERPSKVDGLTKQTYSVTVHMPGTTDTRKWHIVAYFSARDYNQLPVFEDYDYLRNIRVPEGVFISTRPTSVTFDRCHQYAEGFELVRESLTPVAAQFKHGTGSIADLKLSPHPSESTPNFPLFLPPPIAQRPAYSQGRLPPLSSLGYPSPRPSLLYHSSSPAALITTRHSSLCSEDRRILDKFRVVI
ncbi:Gti1/Pac2 family-domain-containing protein [Mycena sp. CBHHK59/15]|nr:Gti1/Pac2 family-domain-containing protein [Mycena sp. CBHHK59/15]